MSIFDDVKKAAVKQKKDDPQDAAAAATVGTEGGDHGAGNGLTSVNPNNMGGFSTDDGHGHVDQWLPNNVGGFWHP